MEVIQAPMPEDGPRGSMLFPMPLEILHEDRNCVGMAIEGFESSLLRDFYEGQRLKCPVIVKWSREEYWEVAGNIPTYYLAKLLEEDYVMCLVTLDSVGWHRPKG